MGQHRRFPGSFLLVIAVLAIPSALYGLLTAAEHADECAAISRSITDTARTKGLKCE